MLTTETAERPLEDLSNGVQAGEPRTSSGIGYIVRAAQKITARLDARFPFSLTLKILALALAVSWYALVPIRLMTVNDSDLGWLMRSGEWMVQHHQFPHTDPFSITGAGHTWVAYSSSFGLLMYEIAKNFDYQGIAAYSLLAWIAIASMLFVLVRGQGAGFWRAIGLTVAAGYVMEMVVAPRPGTITTLLFLLLFHILLREREKGYTRRIWWIPFIIWIWANVHVQFAYGLFALGLFCIEPLLDRIFLRREQVRKFSPQLWMVLGVSTLLTLLNPYGFGPYQVILDFLHQPQLARMVVETRAMPFTVPVNFLVLLLTLAAAFFLGRRSQVRPLWVVLLTWTAISAFRMERDVWLVTAVAVAIIAQRAPGSQPAPRESSRLWVYGIICAILISFFALERVPSNKYLLSLVASVMPVGAVAYLNEHHLPGPIFNDYDWGGFLIYALPNYPVSIDGRTNVHGQDEVKRSLETWALYPGWDRDPLLKGANLVIGNVGAPLTNYLRRDPEFKVDFEDGTCVLFQRVKPVNAKLEGTTTTGKK